MLYSFIFIDPKLHSLPAELLCLHHIILVRPLMILEDKLSFDLSYRRSFLLSLSET